VKSEHYLRHRLSEEPAPKGSDGAGLKIGSGERSLTLFEMIGIVIPSADARNLSPLRFHPLWASTKVMKPLRGMNIEP
jgi:hypothetical protein